MFQKKGYFFILVLLISCYSAAGQKDKRIALSLSSVLFPEFVKEVEERTGAHFYYDPVQTDSFKVTIATGETTLKDLLDTLFVHTPYHFVITADNKVYITKQTAIRASLPNYFFDRQIHVTDSVQKNKIASEPIITTDKLKSSIENRVFEIGTKGATSKNKITLTGYVKDVRNGEPISGVSIYIDSLAANVMTDGYGYYSITLPSGWHVMQVSSAGMKTTKRQIVLNSDGQLNIELTEYIPSLKEVVVTSSRVSNTRSLQMGVSKLTMKNIKQLPVVFGEADILKAVLTLPGVTTVGEASTGFNVRGGSADQNLILLNDATIYNPSHLFGFFSAFNPDVIKSVELYKSTIPERYGGRLSSVLDVAAKEGNNKNFSGNGGIGLLTSKLEIEGPLVKDKGSFVASGRTSYSNWLLEKVPNSAYKNSRASFYDVNLHITHAFNSKNTIYLNGYLSNDQFRLNNDTSYKYGNRNFNLKWKHIFTSKFYGVLTSGADYYHYQVWSESNSTNAFKLKFDINQYNFRTDFNYSLSLKHLLKFGVSSIYYKLHPGSFQPLGVQSLVAPDVLNTEQALESSFYLGDEFTVNPDLSFNAGVRFSVFNYLGPQDQFTYAEGVPRSKNTMLDTVTYDRNKIVKTYSNPEFRFSMRYNLSENRSVKLGLTTTQQYIHMLSNTNAISPTDVWKLSDAYIKPQAGAQVSAGFYQNFKSNTIETSIEVYYKRIKNYLDYKSGAALILNHHIETDVIGSRGKAYGAELSVKKNSGKLNGWMSYTWSRILLQTDDPLAGEAVNNGRYYPANYDKPHNINFSGNYRFSHRYSMSLGVNYSTGRPVTLPLALFNLGGAQRVFYAERNSYRIPSYFRTDLSFMIEGNHKVKQRTHNSWSFGVYNLTARKNAYSVYFIEENGFVKGYQLSIFGTAIPFVTYNFRF